MKCSGETKRPNPLLSIDGGWHQSCSGCDCQHMLACASICVLSLAPWKVDLALWSSATFLIIDLFAHTLMVPLQSRLKRAVTCASFNHARSGVNLRNHNCARTFLTCLAIQIRRSVSLQRRCVLYIPCNLAHLSVLSDFLSSCWTCTGPFDLELHSRPCVTILFGRQVAL